MVVGDILSTHFSNHTVDWVEVGAGRSQALIDIALTLFKSGKSVLMGGGQGPTQDDLMPDESFLRQALAQWSIIFARAIAHGTQFSFFERLFVILCQC